MKHSPPLYFLFHVFLCFLLSSQAFAQYTPYQEPYRGMHTLKAKPAPPKEETPGPKKDEEVEAEKPAEYKALSTEDALIEPDDLEPWQHIDEAALATTDSEIKRLVHVIESDRGAVSPQGLFLAAKSVADRGLMEHAATYFLVAQLRLEFDTARWPATPNKDDLAQRERDSKKSPDQAAPNTNKRVRLDNPHAGTKQLGENIGAPIISWLVKNPARMEKAIKAAKAWDNSAPYSYLPDYTLSEPVPFKKWGKILDKTRESYFSKMMNWSKLMARSRG